VKSQAKHEFAVTETLVGKPPRQLIVTGVEVVVEPVLIDTVVYGMSNQHSCFGSMYLGCAFY
jgi:hypothetical protein